MEGLEIPSTEDLKTLKIMLEDIRLLARLLFKNPEGGPMEIAPYQEEIMKTILYGTHEKNLCWATTRAGKSNAVGMAIAALGAFRPGRKIRIIAPTENHTRIIMDYVIKHIFDSQLISGQLDVPTGMGKDRLRREMNKRHFSFKNGTDVRVLTASIANEGRTLVGEGATDVFGDEVELIPAEIIRTKVMRMTGSCPDPLYFFISNPLAKGYMFDQMKNPEWRQLRYDWRDAVAAGRISEKFVAERKIDMTPIEFTIWYESKYPEDYENTLIHWDWIMRAIDAKLPEEKSEPVISIGADIAAGRVGGDSTVVTVVEERNGFFSVKEIAELREKDTMKAVGLIKSLDMKWKADRIIVDDVGVGTGVTDRLRELDIAHKTQAFIAGASPENEESKKRFLNRKAEQCFRLRTIFEEGRISIPRNNTLIEQLNAWLIEIMGSTGKNRIIDPEKSPDFADSLMLATARPAKFSISFLEDKEGIIFSKDQGFNEPEEFGPF